MFESPGFLVLFLLAIPWILWSRKQAPRPWAVGGLEPFKNLAPGGQGRRRFPVSLLLGLLALVSAVMALADPRFGEQPSLILLDASLSNQSAGSQNLLDDPWVSEAVAEFRSQRGREVEVLAVGSVEEAIGEEEILAAIRLHAPAGETLVLTDRPAPLGLPERVNWKARSLPPGNAAILHVYPDADGENWWMSWARWGVSGPLGVDLGKNGWVLLENEPAGFDLPVNQAISSVRVEAGATIRLTDKERGAPDGRARDTEWQVPAGISRVSLPAGAHESWSLAIAALWPEAVVVREPPADLVVAFGDEAAPTDAALLLLPWDPFHELEEKEAMASIALAARPLLGSGMARPRSECEPATEPADWSKEAFPDTAVGSRSLARALAGLGGLLFLASLMARRFGL